MTEHATLFKADMVRAVLREVDPKTQTRRLITARNSLVDGVGMSPKRWDAMGFDFSRAWVDPGPSPAGNPGSYLQVPAVRDGQETVHRIYPRVQPGDALWGREAWKAHTTFDHLPPRDIPQSHVWYMADDGYKAESRYRQGMFMPRWASRLVLPVTRVGVEPLQDISEADARAEGADCLIWSGVEGGAADLIDWPLKEVGNPYRNGYALLWSAINGDGSWTANPFVWIYEFRRQP